MSMLPIPVILDCDPGHDDVMAILLAAYSKELDLKAITTVSGNGPIDKVTQNALRFCTLAGQGNIPIAQGATHPLIGQSHAATEIHGESALDGVDLPASTIVLSQLSAVQLMASIIADSPAPVTIIATGPLTNVAQLLTNHPELHSRIRSISIMGGGTERGNWRPLAEFNIWFDPEAADIVFSSGLDIYLCGLNITHQVLITPEIFLRLENIDSHLSRRIVPLMKFFAHAYDTTFNMPEPPLHDPIAVLMVSRPELFTFAHVPVAIEKDGTHTRGATVIDLHGVTNTPKNAYVAIGLDVPAFWDLMIDAVAAISE